MEPEAGMRQVLLATAAGMLAWAVYLLWRAGQQAMEFIRNRRLAQMMEADKRWQAERAARAEQANKPRPPEE